MSTLPESRRARAAQGGGLRSSLDSPDQWSRVKTLFLEALERPPSERNAFVAQVSGDDATLRQEVQSLLASDEAAGALCETPAAALLGEELIREAEAASRLPSGTRLGVYEITEFVA